MKTQTTLGITLAAALAFTALAGNISSVQAGEFGFAVNVGSQIDDDDDAGDDDDDEVGAVVSTFDPSFSANPCLHWKDKYDDTGRHFYKTRYSRCMRRNY